MPYEISTKQSLLFGRPREPFVTVNRPSLTVTVDVPSIQRVAASGSADREHALDVQPEDAVEVARVAGHDAHGVGAVRHRDSQDCVRVDRLLQVGERVVSLVGGVRGVPVARLRRVVGVPAVALAVARSPYTAPVSAQVPPGPALRPAGS